MNQQEVSKLIKFISACFPGFKAVKNTPVAWHIVLEPFDYEEVKQALIDTFRNGQWQSGFAPQAPEIANILRKWRDSKLPENFEDAPQEVQKLIISKVIRLVPTIESGTTFEGNGDGYQRALLIHRRKRAEYADLLYKEYREGVFAENLMLTNERKLLEAVCKE